MSVKCISLIKRHLEEHLKTLKTLFSVLPSPLHLFHRHYSLRKLSQRTNSAVISHLPYDEIKRQGGGEEQSPLKHSLLSFCFFLFVSIFLCHLFFSPYLISFSVSPSHGTPLAHPITSHSLLELQGTGLCFISLLIFLRDWYPHTQIHTMLLCSAGGGEERGLYFPLELGHLMTNDNG